MVPRENKNNAYAKFWRENKEYYGIFESGLLNDDYCIIKCLSNKNVLNLLLKMFKLKIDRIVDGSGILWSNETMWWRNIKRMDVFQASFILLVLKFW